MFAEIILLRLESALRAMRDTTPCTETSIEASSESCPPSRFVPICRGMLFKESRTRH